MLGSWRKSTPSAALANPSMPFLASAITVLLSTSCEVNSAIAATDEALANASISSDSRCVLPSVFITVLFNLFNASSSSSVVTFADCIEL